MPNYGNAKVIGQGWYRGVVNAYSIDPKAYGYSSYDTNAYYYYRVSGWGQLKNIDGYRPSSIQIGRWHPGASDYTWYDKTPKDPNMYCSWSSNWNNTNYDYYITGYVAKTHSTQKMWGSARVQCASNGWSQPTGIELSIPAKPSWSIYYNANGGTSTPATQTKWYGETLKLAGSITKDNTTEDGYIITYNHNYPESTDATSTMTNTRSWSFYRWAAGSVSGTQYQSGADYTSNSSTTMYAVWNSSIATYGSTTLPTPTRPGFTFLGWGTSSLQTSNLLQGGSTYQPASDITLYAIWRANLEGSHVLKAVNTADQTVTPITWQTIINSQNQAGSTLYDVGGQYNSWGVNSNNNVTFCGVEITISYDGSIFIPVKSTSAIVRGGNYYYRIEE